MMRNKIVTTLAPGLPCRHIIHVEADSKDVATTVKRCLKEAEHERIGSIALPAFGTRNILSGNCLPLASYIYSHVMSEYIINVEKLQYLLTA
jgi:O-acetyl-ADP-ribose deacetylase (regulator of RNase III)